MFNKERMRKLEISKAVNIAVGCVMASSLDMNEKREVIESLRRFEKQLEEANEDRAILAEVINTSNYADELNNEYERLKALCED
jgi:cell shape-determining protein MreC